MLQGNHVIPYIEDRILAPVDTDESVIPRQWLDRWGRVLLPEKWTEELWSEQSKDDKRFAYLCLASFKFWFRNIFLPYESLRERGYSPQKLDEIYPRPQSSSRTGLPTYMDDYCDRLQQHSPLGYCVTEKKPDHSDIWNIMTILPTGTLKSTVTGKAFTLYTTGCDPTVSILIALEAKTLGERFISAAKAHINNNKRFRWLHGELHAGDSNEKWQTSCVVVDRPIDRDSPTLEVIGYRGATQGLRFDLVIGDDLITRNNTRTVEARQDMEAWIDGSEFRGRLSPERRMRIIVGTFQHYGDYYHQKKEEAGKKGIWSYFEQDMIIGGTWPPELEDPSGPRSVDNVIIPEDLETIWPQEWTAKKLVEEWVDNATQFARERENEVIDPETKVFPAQKLEDVKADGRVFVDDETSHKPLLSRWPLGLGIPPEGHGLYNLYDEMGFSIPNMFFVLSIDFASTETSYSDYTVFQLWGFDRKSLVRVLLNQLRRRTGDPDEMGRALKSWVEAYRPNRLVVEANAVEKLFARSLPQVVGMPVNIAEMKQNKTDMIHNMRDLIGAKLIWVPYADDSYGTKHTFARFIDELDQYPFGDYDDTVAAAAHALYDMRSMGAGRTRARVIKGRSPNDLAGIISNAEEVAVGSEKSRVRAVGGQDVDVTDVGLDSLKIWDVLNLVNQQSREDETGFIHPAKHNHGKRHSA